MEYKQFEKQIAGIAGYKVVHGNTFSLEKCKIVPYTSYIGGNPSIQIDIRNYDSNIMFGIKWEASLYSVTNNLWLLISACESGTFILQENEINGGIRYILNEVKELSTCMLKIKKMLHL